MGTEQQASPTGPQHGSAAARDGGNGAEIGETGESLEEMTFRLPPGATLPVSAVTPAVLAIPPAAIASTPSNGQPITGDDATLRAPYAPGRPNLPIAAPIPPVPPVPTAAAASSPIPAHAQLPVDDSTIALQPEQFAWLAGHGGDGGDARDLDAEISAPRLDPTGALTTSIGEPGHADQLAAVARAAQRRALNDVASVVQGLAELATAMHRHAKELEPLVEGHYSTDLSDPRTHQLARSLEVAQQADWRLAQLELSLRRLSSSVQTAETNINALQAERARLATLYQIAQDLNTSLDLDELLGRVMAQLIEVVHAERGFLLLWDETRGELRFAAARGADGQPLSESDSGVSRGVIAEVWERQAPLLTTDARDDERLRENLSVVVYNIRSVMCAPLRVRGHAVGVVYVDSRTTTRLFDASHLDLLAAFCNQAAIAIDNARLIADLRRRIREISEMKTYMDNIFASIASGVVTADMQGLVTTFNAAAERIFHLAGERVIGQRYDAALTGLLDEHLLAVLRRSITTGEVTLGYEMQRTLPERGEVSLRLNVSPLRKVAGATDAEMAESSATAGSAAGEALGVALVVDDLTELRRSQRQAREIQRLFGRYVHPAVVNQLLADPSAVHLGGETRLISVIFADIRNYTRFAEERAPEAVVRVLNQYLNILTEAIWQEEGTLTMFIGDALMAIFNAPLPQPDHARRAVRAAWAMRQALARQSSLPGAGEAGVEYGIGVHTGYAVVGNIGAHDRLQNYTAIGDAVNTAQRLQSSASANQILLSADTYEAVKDLVFAASLGALPLKGKTHPLPVYQLDGLR